jgi:trimeric autotransporter adhesin
MSTKTTFKRIALVAVAALGFGVLTSISPASATAGTGNVTPSALTVGTIPTAQVGVAHVTPITITAPTNTLALIGSDTVTINVRVMSAPTGSAFRSLASMSKLADGSNNGTFVLPTFATGNNIGAQIGFTATSGGIVSTTAGLATDLMTVGTNFTTTPKTEAARVAGSMGALTVNITPDVAGTYTVLVSTSTSYTNASTAVAAAYTAGQTNVSYTFTTGAAVTAVALSAVTPTSTVGSTGGQVIRVTLTGALGVNENIRITDNSATASLWLVSDRRATGHTLEPAASTLTMTSAHFVGGVGYFVVSDTAATTSILTATGSGLLSPTISSTLSVETVAAYVPTNVTMSDTAANVTAGGQANHVSGITAAASITDRASTAATSHSYLATFTAGALTDRLRVLVDDAQGRVTGVVGLDYTYALAPATTTTATVTVAAACATAGACFTASVDGATDGVVAVTAEAPVQTTVTAAGSTSTTMRAAFGASTVLQVVLRDQFRNALANSSAGIVTTGRNSSAGVVTTLNTDANGIVTFTRTDAGTATTANRQDVVTFTATTGTGSAAITINYTDSTLGISTVTLATPTTDDTASTGTTWTDIDASSTAGATGSATARTWTTITATVKDVNGAVLIGVPVTFATTSAGAAVASTFATVYTGADGTAASRVYGWTAGVKTFTATAGTTVATGTVAFRQGGATQTSGATEVRTISAVRTGNSIVVTALDRFGNVVAGVPLFATRTGNGTFGGGSNTNGQTTGANGTAEFLFNGGSADSVVTITAGSLIEVPAVSYGQTGFPAGMNSRSTAATAVPYTAFVAGTTTTAEIGVGASFAPAGIGSVTVAVPADTAAADAVSAAADAAAEATDAANAATDAANAAAEAADAATAAAQDAADAVAALSTQVTELISSLRRQITSLTNLVIKIQRKVRA